MRRGSIVGPLLLIAVGGLFLANNLRPELDFVELLGRYWPYLLIAWGALRLLEIAVWAMRGKLLPERGLSGGEWTAIVFIALIGSGLFAVQRHGWWNAGRLRIHGIEMFGEAYDYNIAEQKAAAGKTPRVVIENLRGNARVVGAETEDVTVSGRKTIRAIREEDARSADQNTGIEVVKQGDAIIVRTNLERADSRMRVHADLDITVPKGASIEGRGRYGDFDITDLEGNVEIRSDNSGVRVQNLTGKLLADLRRTDIIRAVNVKGAVDLRVTGQADNVELDNVEGPVNINGSYYEVRLRRLAQPVRFDGMQTDFSVTRCLGEIHMTPNTFTADTLVGPVTLSTSRAKDVQITDATESVTVQLDRGDIELRASKEPLPKMNLQTGNGDVRLALPENAKFSLSGTTHRGEVFNDYGDVVRATTSDRSASIAASTGGPEIVINTDRGNLTVRKATGEIMARPSVEWPADPPKPPKPPRLPKLPKVELQVEKS